MRIALATDAWAPQVNGVVRTLGMTVDQLRLRGHAVEVITPDGFRTVPCPSYSEIRLAIGCRRETFRRLDRFAPDAVHIATEGPLGWAARSWCLDREMPFSTSFHTRFPDYAALRTRLPASWFWPAVRRFHAPARTIMTATETLARELADHGLPQTHRWSRGVDLDQFTPDGEPLARLTALPRPIQLYVGRVAIEKNIGAFLGSDVPGSKLVVGDGPARAALATQYPDVHFLGALHGTALAAAYRTADVFVFPSRTDTFGLVLIEALASGTPVAAYPVAGPLDVLGREAGGRPVGALDEDLGLAIRRALAVDPDACVTEARRYSWAACTDQFLDGLSLRERSLALA